MIRIRVYLPSVDCEIVVRLFYETVHCVNANDYSQSQLDAWAPFEINLSEWDKRLSSNYTILAEENKTIVGFGSVTSEGYFDLLYVHKDFLRMGIATKIADTIEEYCRVKGIKSITTDASVTAKPFFEKMGYVVLKEQIVGCRGEKFTNFKMTKELFIWK